MRAIIVALLCAAATTATAKEFTEQEEMAVIAQMITINAICGDEYRSVSEINKTIEFLAERRDVPRSIIRRKAVELAKPDIDYALGNDEFTSHFCRSMKLR